MREAKSDSPTKCGLCGGEAFVPERFAGDDAQAADGVFNVCGSCEAECTGTGAYSETDRWYWTGSREAAAGRAGLEAAELDAEWAETQRWD